MVADVAPCPDPPVSALDPPVDSSLDLPLDEPPTHPPPPSISGSPTAKARRPHWRVALSIASALLVLSGVVYWAHDRWESGSRVFIAVLPFSDLTTQEMNEEFFADGLTEELIGDLSKIPAFQVPAPTTVFYYKGKQLPPADIAQQLGVTYLVDGSVRKSGNSYRVATRLIRADNGYVMWSEAYDRPLGDLVQVQKDVAAEATKAVRASLDSSATASPAVAIRR
jgi:transcriptional activator of cad operon